MRRSTRKPLEPNILAADIDDIIRAQRVEIPAGARTVVDYMAATGKSASRSKEDMAALAKKHGWKTAIHKGRRYWWA